MTASLSANVVNPGFETGNLAPWGSAGVGEIVLPPFTYAGDYAAVIQTGASGGQGEGETLVSLNLFSGSPASVATIETQLGLPAGTIAGLGSSPTEGSALWQDFNYASAGSLSFSWRYVTGEGEQSYFNDFSFYSLVNLDNNSASAALLADTYGPSDTGWQVLSIPIPTAGNYRIGFGVFDSNDADVNTALYVDSGEVSPVPEVSTRAAVAMTGLATAGIWLRRRNRKS